MPINEKIKSTGFCFVLECIKTLYSNGHRLRDRIQKLTQKSCETVHKYHSQFRIEAIEATRGGVNVDQFLWELPRAR